MTNADEIRERMSQVRNDIDQDVDELVEETRSLVDWREYVRSYPLVAVAAAAAAGYFAVPKRPKVVQADASMVSRMMDNEKIVLAPNANVRHKMSGANGLLGSVVGVVLRSVAGQVGHQLAAKFSSKIEPPESDH